MNRGDVLSDLQKPSYDLAAIAGLSLIALINIFQLHMFFSSNSFVSEYIGSASIAGVMLMPLSMPLLYGLLRCVFKIKGRWLLH